MIKRFLEIGSKIKIRSLEWFEYNKCSSEYIGRFTIGMSKYCGMDATILSFHGPLYGYGKDLDTDLCRLDIDDGFWYWQDYMFDPKSIVFNYRFIKNYCNNVCKLNCIDSKDICPFYYSNLELFSIGDKVRIRDGYWLGKLGCSKFNKKMIEYCNKEATIINKYIINNNITIYKLNIDNGFWNWQDFMFRSPVLIELGRIINNICSSKCIYECKGDSCTLYKYKEKVI